MHGWIKLHRKFNNWEWRDSPKHVSVFLDLLLNANHKDKKYRGMTIKKGQLTTSYNAISQRTKVSIRSIRTILKDLKSTHEVTHENMRHFSLITITNWDEFQETTQELTFERQPSDKLTTTNKNVKNVKNVKNKIYSRASIDIASTINYLNQKTGSKYKSNSKASSRLINARLNDGYSLQDIKAVIDKKYDEWKDTDMKKYLRPETLFNATKFESYLNEGGSNKESDEAWAERMQKEGRL